MLAEGLDRLSRSQGLSVNLYATCVYMDVELHTIAELVERITIRHDADLGHTAQIDGKLMGLLGFTDGKNAADLSGAACSLKLVAGA